MSITVQNFNNSHIKVYGDRGIEMELKEAFSFMAPNYRFNPKYKARMWDGRISLYNIGTKRMPAGLLSHVLEYCKSQNVDVNLVDFDKQTYPTITADELTKFIEELNIHAGGNKIDLRDYQFDCILKSINDRRVTSKVPTSGGKSLIIYVLMRWLLSHDLRFMLVVPTIMLVGQMFTDFEDYSSHNGFNVGQFCHKLHGGEAKEFIKPVLISTWQSISAMDRKGDNSKIWNTYDAVCIDEAHQTKSQELVKLLEKMVDVGYRFGTTGTIDGAAVNKMTIEGHLGPIYSAITTSELMERGQVSNLTIKTLILKYPEDQAKLVKDYDYQDEVKYLTTNVKRNHFICNVAMTLPGTTLVLVQNVESHAVPLYEILKAKSTKPVYYISGTVKPTEREAIRQKAMVEDCIVVATYQTLSTGVNIPNLHNVIFGSPSKSLVRILQSIGRGLRLHKDKLKMTLIDIVDNLKYKRTKNFALDHFEERLKIYQLEKFNIKIKEVPFN